MAHSISQPPTFFDVEGASLTGGARGPEEAAAPRRRPGAPAPAPLGIAFVGCGFVADFYRVGLPLHLDRLNLVGVFDRKPERMAAFHATWGDPTFESLDALLADPRVDIVVNLTDPENHAAVTAAAVAAGKHVYSEKPLGMTTAEAGALVTAAAEHGVRLAGAPSNVLGEHAQTLWREVRRGRVGTVRLVYAEIDDGMIHRTDFRAWRSRSGANWPAEGEFEVGCTFEHAGYVLTLLVAMFGPVRRVVSHAALLVPSKGTGTETPHYAPDFSCGCLVFDGGVVARLTNSIIAPYDHRLRIVGEAGTLEVEECWDFGSPIRVKPTSTTRLQRFLDRRFPRRRGRKIKPVRQAPHFRGGPAMDFVRGIREFGDAILEDRPCRLSPELALHITEVTERLQHPERFTDPALPEVRLPPFAPMPWAE